MIKRILSIYLFRIIRSFLILPLPKVYSLLTKLFKFEKSYIYCGVTGKFGLEIQNKAGQRLIEFCQENALVIANNLFQQHKRRL